MNASEVEELFIEAASIDRRLPISVRPAQVKSMSLPFVHSFEERLAWEPADMAGGEIIRDSHGRQISEAMRKKLKRVLGDQLEFGDKGRRDIEAELFWQGAKITPEEVTLWEKANELIRLVKNEDHRRALLNWSIAKAGGRPFARWCRADGLLPETGRWRKNVAVNSIISAISCVDNTFTRNNAEITTLSNQPENGTNFVNIGQSRSWMAEGAKPLACDFDSGLGNFEWAEQQNEARRAKRKKQAATA